MRDSWDCFLSFIGHKIEKRKKKRSETETLTKNRWCCRIAHHIHAANHTSVRFMLMTNRRRWIMIIFFFNCIHKIAAYGHCGRVHSPLSSSLPCSSGEDMMTNQCAPSLLHFTSFASSPSTNAVFFLCPAISFVSKIFEWETENEICAFENSCCNDVVDRRRPEKNCQKVTPYPKMWYIKMVSCAYGVPTVYS